MSDSTGPEARRQRDCQFVNGILADPHSAWPGFQIEYSRCIRRAVRRFHFSPEDEEEVFQEVCHTLVKDDYNALKAWNSESSSLCYFVSLIALRTAINFSKSRFHAFSNRKAFSIEGLSERDPDSLLDLDRPTRTVRERLEAILIVEYLERELTRCVKEGKMKPEDRLLVSFRLQGHSLGEIAILLKIPVEHLRVRFFRLRPQLRSLLVKGGIGESDSQGLSCES
jgi:RNA polymerase sigma factor (sigma-70 family)